jgi:hypothetical protein
VKEPMREILIKVRDNAQGDCEGTLSLAQYRDVLAWVVDAIGRHTAPPLSNPEAQAYCRGMEALHWLDESGPVRADDERRGRDRNY